jgi:hypothetical protein
MAWLDLLAWVAIIYSILGFTGLLPETVLGFRIWFTKKLDKISPPEQRALLREKDRMSAVRQQLVQYEGQLDVFLGKLRTAITNADIAKTAFEESVTKAQVIAGKGNPSDTATVLESAAEARDAWQRRVAIAQEYQNQYDRLSLVYGAMVEQVRQGQIELDKAESEVILTTASRLAGSLQEQALSLQAAATHPNTNREVIREALATQKARQERLGPSRVDQIYADDLKAHRLTDMAAELGIVLLPAPTSAPALPAPTEALTDLTLTSGKDTAGVPVNRE